MAAHMKEVKKLSHHSQNEICTTRAKYRQGRKLTAVKVYTINQESKYLLILGVPCVGAKTELANVCSEYGVVEEINALDDYPTEKYTEAFCVKYQLIQNARFAKKKLDDRSFFGGCLHVCYAPEFETVTDTREKLADRRRIVAAKTRDSGSSRARNDKNFTGSTSECTQGENDIEESEIQPVTLPEEPTTYIWAGKTYKIERPPEPSKETVEQTSQQPTSSQIPFIPRQLKRPAAIKPDSFESTANSIRDKLNAISEPTLSVNIKKRKIK